MRTSKNRRSSPGPVLSGIIRLLPSDWADRALAFSLSHPDRTIERLARLDPEFLENLGRRKAYRAFERAWRGTPAYRDFLTRYNLDPTTIRSFADFRDGVPLTTKENYVRAFPLASRCQGGILPPAGTLDESAGTTDTATNWVRVPAEDRGRAAITDLAMYYLFRMRRGGNWVLINGYLPGAWAGSQRFAASLAPFGVLKNTGPDPAKIVGTLRDLGPGLHYLIGGYPPFLKELVDYGCSVPGFDWTGYHVDILTGGEGFVEEWRDYLAERLGPGARIFSNYGAVDTDAGLSMENSLTVAIKRLAWRDPALRSALFGSNRLPCFLGQYSPLSFWLGETVQTDRRREFDVTVLSPAAASPKVRYNVGDEGGIIPFVRMRAVLEARGYVLSEVLRHPDGWPAVPFPFLYIFGRSDGSVFCDGATFSPPDIQAALWTDTELAASVRTFSLSVIEEEGRPARLAVDLELNPGTSGTGAGLENLGRRARDILVTSLGRSNSCFRKSVERDAVAAAPRVRVFASGTGPFDSRSNGAKYRYVLKTSR